MISEPLVIKNSFLATLFFLLRLISPKTDEIKLVLGCLKNDAKNGTENYTKNDTQNDARFLVTKPTHRSRILTILWQDLDMI